jgi:hypothetical protein
MSVAVAESFPSCFDIKSHRFGDTWERPLERVERWKRRVDNPRQGSLFMFIDT